MIQVTTDGPTFAGNATQLPSVTGEAVTTKLAAAAAYWDTPATGQQLSEVLLGGRVTVTKIVRTF